MKEEAYHRLSRLKPILKEKWGVKKIGYFNEYLDVRHTLNCELNILVELEKPLGWEFFALKEFIQEKLELPIDICTPKALKPAIKDEILSTVRFV